MTARRSSAIAMALAAVITLGLVGALTFGESKRPRPAAPTYLVGTIRSAMPARGRLVVGWLTAEEAAGWKKGDVSGETFRALIERFHVGDVVDARDASYRVEAPRAATPLVIVDVERTFWSTLFGGGKGLVGVGAPGGGEVRVESKPAPPSGPEPCAGERMQLLTVDAPEVAGSIGNPTTRRFCVYLPPSYVSAPQRRYPIVLLFGGFMSNEMVRFRGKNSAKDVGDAIARETGREAIFVGVDAATKTGSTYLEDSPITGQWDSFLAGRGLAAIDTTFRTLATRESRGIIGQSTGGFLAISYALRHSDRFGALGATAPDALSLDTWLLDAPDRPKPWIVAWTRLEAALGGPGQMTSYAADWSAGAWPFDLETGKPNANLARWQARSPVQWLNDPAFATTVRQRLGGNIFIATSAQDEFGLTEPALAFSAKLHARGVEHTLDVSDAGHLAGGNARTEKAIRFVVAHLAAAGP